MIKPYKERTIDYSKPVRVYRNLTSKTYSIKQNGKVVGHADSLTLRDCNFIVFKNGQKRVRETGHKTVHAFIEGTISETRLKNCCTTVLYNPKVNDTFIGVSPWGKHILNFARIVLFKPNKVEAHGYRYFGEKL